MINCWHRVFANAVLHRSASWRLVWIKVVMPSWGSQATTDLQESTMDHLLTIAFDTQDSARAAFAKLHAGQSGPALADACLASRDLDGMLDVAVSQSVDALGPDFWERLVRGLSHSDAEATGLPQEFTEHVAASLRPGRSALIALTDGVDVGPLLGTLGEEGRMLRCELGDGGREALRRRIDSLPNEAAVADPMVWQAGFGSFQ